MKISIITPVFNEEENLNLFYERIKEIFKKLSHNSNKQIEKEIIFIDDGSTDNSFQRIKELATKDNNIKGISLSKNHGSHIAISVGLSKATGDAVVIIAADLQDPPELIVDFFKRWQSGAQIVWGKRAKYESSFLRAIINKIFYTLVKTFAIKTYPSSGTGSFCLIDKKIVGNLNRHFERNRVTFGLIAYQGYKQDYVEYDRIQRQIGTSGWSKSKLIKAGLDLFLSFSYFPVRFMSTIGILTFAISILGVIYVTWCWFSAGIKVSGWATITVLLFTFNGLQFLMLGILGEYIWRVADEVKGRPLYFIQDVTEPSLN